MAPPNSGYDPWTHLYQRWPSVEIVVEALTTNLLGETRYPPLQIALAAQSSAAQRRCTLAHEIVHLERGFDDPGVWAEREERLVHAEACRRLIGTAELANAIRELGGSDDLPALAALLDVDLETIKLRLRLLDPRDRRAIRRRARTINWSLA